MGAHSGPNIVEDGLVFSFDMRNIVKSWKGRPTTNLVRSPFSSSFAKSVEVESLSNENSFYPGGNVLKIKNNGYLAFVRDQDRFNVGNTYTVSWFVKYYSNETINFSWGGSHSGDRSTFTFNLISGEITNLNIVSNNIYGANYLEDGWWQVYYSSYLSGSYFYPQINLNGDFILGGIQIEQGFVPSYFVNGSRNSTEALIDLTSNHVITLQNISYNNNNTFEFDGTDDYSFSNWNFIRSNFTNFMF